MTHALQSILFKRSVASFVAAELGVKLGVSSLQFADDCYKGHDFMQRNHRTNRACRGSNGRCGACCYFRFQSRQRLGVALQLGGNTPGKAAVAVANCVSDDGVSVVVVAVKRLENLVAIDQLCLRTKSQQRDPIRGLLWPDGWGDEAHGCQRSDGKHSCPQHHESPP